MDERDDWITEIENGYVFSALVAQHEPPRQEATERLEQGPRLMALLRDPARRQASPAERDLEQSRR